MMGWFGYIKDLNDTYCTPGQTNIVNYEEFYKDAASGNLAPYTFL